MEPPRSIGDIRGSEIARASHTHSPRDWRDRIMYLLMVDRFDNDDLEVPPFDADSAEYGRDPEQGAVAQGGRVSGITRRLDYLKELGIGAIWMTPVVKNRQVDPYIYHGYAAQNFLEVDPRFGTMEDLQHLVEEAHERKIAVILDIVLNHTGDVWAYTDGEAKSFSPDRHDFGFWREAEDGQDEMEGRIWPQEFQNPDWYRRQGEIEDYTDPEQLVHGDIPMMKTLDTSNHEVLDALIECYKFWISATDCDGFRVDTVRNMEPESVAIVCNALREHALSLGKHNFLIFGEVIAGDGVIHDYLEDTPDVEGDRDRLMALDGALDYPVYFLLEEVIKGKMPAAELAEKLRDRLDQEPADRVSTRWVTFLDNHDQPMRKARFMHESEPPLGGLGVTYLLTSLGIPCLYYGTEQGFDGGGEEDYSMRECMFGGNWGAFDTTGMHFFDPEHPLYQTIAKVAFIRAQEPALRYGRQYFRGISTDGAGFDIAGEQGTLAYSRILDDEEVLVALNISTERREDAIEVDPERTPPGRRVADLISDDEYQVEQTDDGKAFVRVPLDGRAIAILKLVDD